jgi:hypothetical protein
MIAVFDFIFTAFIKYICVTIVVHGCLGIRTWDETCHTTGDSFVSFVAAFTNKR